MAIDLATDRVVKTIVLPPSVVLPTTYLNDVRFDLRQGAEGVAYITDSSNAGIGGIIVVDIASERAIRRLSNHLTTNPEPGFTPVVDGAVLMNRPPMDPRRRSRSPATQSGSAPTAACSTTGRCRPHAPCGAHGHAARSCGDRGGTGPRGTQPGAQGARTGLPKTTGAACSPAITRTTRSACSTGPLDDGGQRPRISWPDTLSIGTGGYLYFTANQLHRQPGFHGGGICAASLRAAPHPWRRAVSLLTIPSGRAGSRRAAIRRINN